MCWILKIDFHEINKTSKENNILNVCVSKSENPLPDKYKVSSDWHDRNLSTSRTQTDRGYFIFSGHPDRQKYMAHQLMHDIYRSTTSPVHSHIYHVSK